MLIDAHAHIDADRRNILTVLCGTNPRSCAEVLRRCSDLVIPCCALHPWFAQGCFLDDMLPFIEQSPILGEIGLDSVWTDVPMDTQRGVFRKQLDLAEKLQKPIVLHTKGMEKEIAETIAPYSMRKLVHWYSCMEHLELYIEQDCYFTVGPDCNENPAVQEVIRQAPLDRLLTETDGLDAVEWALGRKVAADEIEDVLRRELQAIADAKGINPDAAEQAVYQNLMRFIYGNEAAREDSASSGIRS